MTADAYAIKQVLKVVPDAKFRFNRTSRILEVRSKKLITSRMMRMVCERLFEVDALSINLDKLIFVQGDEMLINLNMYAMYIDLMKTMQGLNIYVYSAHIGPHYLGFDYTLVNDKRGITDNDLQKLQKTLDAHCSIKGLYLIRSVHTCEGRYFIVRFRNSDD